MFNKEELEQAIRRSKERETIRVEYEDGKVLEHKAKIWTVCGLDPETKTEFSWGKVCIVGGEDVMAEVLMHMAQLQLVVEEIRSALVNAAPDLDNDTLTALLEYGMENRKKKRESDNA